MSDDYFAELAKLASDLSKKTSQLDEMMQAIYNVNASFGDREKLMKLINHMAKFNKPKPDASKTDTPKTDTPKTATPSNPSTSAPNAGPKGDFMYDLFNSPAMMSIIKEHYNKKKK
ncbi:hypothetical protein MK805_01340 [Shimazuella sp. AN120528]|uniref:hypothetical protein n=1 Tax=Shimazuella soli TaxID=1892854 RepID=UPI001F0F303D|nr:hypothetical protein [Shimazuella soli]MCH5583615.1 hypothetical protein [Shimazuella soli]